MGDELKTDSAGEKPFSPRSHRKALGIPEELADHPVLFISSHRGVLDARYPSHIAEFQKVMAGEDSLDTDMEYAYLDLTTATQDQIISHLREVLARVDPGHIEKRLTSGTGQNDPPPGLLGSVQYLPPIDSMGRTKEPSVTFAIDIAVAQNASEQLKELEKFLREKGILERKSSFLLPP